MIDLDAIRNHRLQTEPYRWAAVNNLFDPADLETEMLPAVGNSAVIVQSEDSWRAVSRVVNGSAVSRRSVTVTFYRPGAVSTLWPPGHTRPLHRYQMANR
jgi:SM-20-related protein